MLLSPSHASHASDGAVSAADGDVAAAAAAAADDAECDSETPTAPHASSQECCK